MFDHHKSILQSLEMARGPLASDALVTSESQLVHIQRHSSNLTTYEPYPFPSCLAELA